MFFKSKPLTATQELLNTIKTSIEEQPASWRYLKAKTRDSSWFIRDLVWLDTRGAIIIQTLKEGSQSEFEEIKLDAKQQSRLLEMLEELKATWALRSLLKSDNT